MKKIIFNVNNVNTELISVISEVYYQNGHYHRLNGPAFIYYMNFRI
jgi:hypothetical protein